jgi:hypothetical protein
MRDYARCHLPAYAKRNTPLLDSVASVGRNALAVNAAWRKRRRFQRVTTLIVLTAFAALVCGSTPAATAAPTTVDFEQFVGPSVFGAVDSPLTIGIATFSGGELLTNTSGLTANQSSVYGTAFFCRGCQPDLTISFSKPVTDFSVLVISGMPDALSYTVTSQDGSTSTGTIPSFLQDGSRRFSLADPAITSVTVRLAVPQPEWDFFIDDVRFSPALPTSKDQCKNGGWRNFGDTFKNQGQCVAFVQRGPKPKP